tara:strand:- start:6280 stop:7563 length:1284 start_codon:yes stop_codon:yes gene_type:complete
MIIIYRILTNLLYPFLVLLIYIRTLKQKEHQKRYKEKLFPSFFNVTRNSNSRLIWFHAASIGEFKSILPLVYKLKSTEKNLEFLITTVTLSSSNLAYKEFEKVDNVHHRFFPLDVNFIIKKFLSLWKPSRIFLVDSEIWPNLILETKKRKIPLALLNARITKKTFDKWKFVPFLPNKIFNSFDLCLSSNNETSHYLKKLDAKNIYDLGNLKLVNQVNIDEIKNINESFLIKNKFWFIASTHEGEETFCLKVHFLLKKKYNKIYTIIAPRHISRVRKIKNLCDKLNLKCQILNENEYISEEKEIIILNSFGILPNYFKFSKSVFIGKSLLKKKKMVSGQNPIDAANCGCKIYHGPYVYNFEEVYEILAKNNISKQINTFQELAENLILDFENSDNERKKDTAIMNKLSEETLNKYINYIEKFLKNEIY